MVKQKHFLDIQHIREEDTELRQSNTKAFEVGDIIQISEKIDNANACITFDPDEGCLVAFSRKQTLSFNNTLNGFWNYAQSLDVSKWVEDAKFYVFGEWSGMKNKIVYNDSQKRKWYVYDIYDSEAETYMPQWFVKIFCETHGLTYVNVLYEGPFISWEHCKSFMNKPAYGDQQEGIVVKNQSKLLDAENRSPSYLKIVNEAFHEKMARVKVEKTAEELAEEERNQQLAESIITPNRIEKELFKMRDEGIVPPTLLPSDMRLVAQNLPKRIYDDCMKEDKEIVMSIGEKFSKLCSSLAMKHARNLICK